jgi:hypothetical protein
VDSLSPYSPGGEQTSAPTTAITPPPSGGPPCPPEDDWGDCDDGQDTTLAPPDVEYRASDSADVDPADYLGGEGGGGVVMMPLLIHAPVGALPVQVGYTVVAAVIPPGHDEPLVSRYLDKRTFLSLDDAIRVALERSTERSKLCIPRATHILIHDERGKVGFTLEL